MGTRTRGDLKIAVVHEWFAGYTGAERVTEQILKLYPAADLYCVVECLPKGTSTDFLCGRIPSASVIQRLPFGRSRYKAYLPLMPWAMKNIDLSDYDLVISGQHCASHGITSGDSTVRISYVHTPMRYAWDLREQYLAKVPGLLSVPVELMLDRLQKWDFKTAQRIHAMSCNSKYIRERIRNNYKRDARVIYPPVEVRKEMLVREKESYYLTASRLVPYKRIDIIVEAFNEMPDKRLVVIGDGPKYAYIRRIAKPNITVLGYQDSPTLIRTIQKARAFLFAAEEDFGIVPLEAQACGTPVIAYGRGGSLETVLEDETGIFFPEQSKQAICDAVLRFEASDGFDPDSCFRHAYGFRTEVFAREFRQFVDSTLAEFTDVRS